MLFYGRPVKTRRPFAHPRALGRLFCVLMAVLALGGRIAVASQAADRAAGLVASQASGGVVVMCGSRSRFGTAAPAHPKRRLVVRPVGVMPSSGDADDLLAPDHRALCRPEPDFIRLAGQGLALPGPPAVTGVRPYPRGPPVPG